MRVIRHLALAGLLLLCILVEREHPLVPITWVALGLLVLRREVPLVLIMPMTLLADFALALPLGMSALVSAVLTALLQRAPRKILARGIFYACLGATLGIVYGALRHSLPYGLPFFTAGLCTVLYLVGSRTPAIEEIGHAQE